MAGLLRAAGAAGVSAVCCACFAALCFLDWDQDLDGEAGRDP